MSCYPAVCRAVRKSGPVETTSRPSPAAFFWAGARSDSAATTGAFRACSMKALADRCRNPRKKTPMTASPIRYVEPVFRPPSEANSLILPVTDGCSWNQCTFCEMYTAPQKKFKARSEDEVLEMIRRCRETFGDQVRRIFLADGDALVLPTHRLLRILEAIAEHMPWVERISSYCLARNLKRKSVA